MVDVVDDRSSRRRRRPGHAAGRGPGLLDPNFRRTVVFVIEHRERGSLGVVLNRPSEVAGARRAARLGAAGVATAGGVRRRPGRRKHRAVPRRAARRPRPGGVDGVVAVRGPGRAGRPRRRPGRARASAARPAGLRRLLRAGTPASSRPRSSAGDWIVVPALPDDVWTGHGGDLWGRVLRRQGMPLSLLATFPTDVRPTDVPSPVAAGRRARGVARGPGEARVEPAGGPPRRSSGVAGRQPATRSHPAHVPVQAGAASTAAVNRAAARLPSAPPTPVSTSVPTPATANTTHATSVGPPASTTAPPAAATIPAAPSGTAATRLASVNAACDDRVFAVRTPAHWLRGSREVAPRTATASSAIPTSTSSEPAARRSDRARPRSSHLGAILLFSRPENSGMAPKCGPSPTRSQVRSLRRYPGPVAQRLLVDAAPA